MRRAALAFVLATVLASAAVATVADARQRAARACPSGPPLRHVVPVTRPRWLSDVIVTEYYPAPERWFAGKRVSAPGLSDRHSVDWLYEARGLAMEGQGVGRDGRFYHFAGPFGSPWVNRNGRRTSPCWNGDWTDGRPAWLALGWRNTRGRSRSRSAAGAGRTVALSESFRRRRGRASCRVRRGRSSTGRALPSTRI